MISGVSAAVDERALAASITADNVAGG